MALAEARNRTLFLALSELELDHQLLMELDSTSERLLLFPRTLSSVGTPSLQ